MLKSCSLQQYKCLLYCQLHSMWNSPGFFDMISAFDMSESLLAYFSCFNQHKIGNYVMMEFIHTRIQTPDRKLSSFFLEVCLKTVYSSDIFTHLKHQIT